MSNTGCGNISASCRYIFLVFLLFLSFVLQLPKEKTTQKQFNTTTFFWVVVRRTWTSWGFATSSCRVPSSSPKEELFRAAGHIRCVMLPIDPFVRLSPCRWHGTGAERRPRGFRCNTLNLLRGHPALTSQAAFALSRSLNMFRCGSWAHETP